MRKYFRTIHQDLTAALDTASYMVDELRLLDSFKDADALDSLEDKLTELQELTGNLTPVGPVYIPLLEKANADAVVELLKDADAFLMKGQQWSVPHGFWPETTFIASSSGSYTSKQVLDFIKGEYIEGYGDDYDRYRVWAEVAPNESVTITIMEMKV